MAADITIVSEDFTRRAGNGHEFAGVYRAGRGSAVLRVAIRQDAYAQQSYARISSWGIGGWQFHSELPVEEWRDLLPSYVKRELGFEDHNQFRWLAGELLERYCEAVWGTTDGVRLHESERASEYAEAMSYEGPGVGV